MSEEARRKWDILYSNLMQSQGIVMEVLGDVKGRELFKAIGDVRRMSERDAPGGWAVRDVLPVASGDTR